MASLKTILLEKLYHKLHPKKSLIVSEFFGLGIGTTSFIILLFIILVTNKKITPFSSVLKLQNVNFRGLKSCNATEIGNFSVIENELRKTHVEDHDLKFMKKAIIDEMKPSYRAEIGNLSVIDDQMRKTYSINLDSKLKNDSFQGLISKGITNGTNDSKTSERFNITNARLANSGQFDANKNNGDDVNLLKVCDIFDGKWVKDDDLPHYPLGSCPYIERDFNCYLNGRPDDEFYKWKWQPFGCNIPRLNATDFLERMRGKKLVFVGDSLNRNMWESLVCILWHSVEDKKKVYEVSGMRQFEKTGFYAFIYEDYNCSIDYVRAPFLVRESTFQKQNELIATLRLDLMDNTTKMYQDADIMIFNTAHWWTHEKTSRGEDYYQEGNYVYPRLKALKAYKKALTTWGSWVDRHIHHNKSLVFFRGSASTHFSGGQWNSGGNCHKETEPIFNEEHLSSYPSKMRVLEHVLGKMKTPVMYLNISRMTDYRKDGHPSIYRNTDEEGKKQSADLHPEDCSHWCLPGVPDLWNELLYASLLKLGWGS